MYYHLYLTKIIYINIQSLIIELRKNDVMKVREILFRNF